MARDISQFKNALVDVSFTLNLSEDRVRQIIESDVLVDPDHPDYYETAMKAIEEHVRDNYTDLLASAGEPEVGEAHA